MDSDIYSFTVFLAVHDMYQAGRNFRITTLSRSIGAVVANDWCKLLFMFDVDVKSFYVHAFNQINRLQHVEACSIQWWKSTEFL